MADSQGPPQVQKAIVSLVALKKRKCLSQFRDETRSSLAPHLHALKRRQYAQLQAIPVSYTHLTLPTKLEV